jgi:hypothetical protein
MNTWKTPGKIEDQRTISPHMSVASYTCDTSHTKNDELSGSLVDDWEQAASLPDQSIAESLLWRELNVSDRKKNKESASRSNQHFPKTFELQTSYDRQDWLNFARYMLICLEGHRKILSNVLRKIDQLLQSEKKDS